MMFTNRNHILSILALGFLLSVTSCTHKAQITPATLIRASGFACIKDQNGRWLNVTSNSQELDEAMKKIQPGPASVDKLNLWIITPLGKSPAN